MPIITICYNTKAMSNEIENIEKNFNFIKSIKSVNKDGSKHVIFSFKSKPDDKTKATKLFKQIAINQIVDIKHF